MTNDSNYVFISFKSEEKASAVDIQHYLEKEGYKCWRAPESLHKRGTQDYGNDIFEAIRNCGCFLLVLSNRALGSDWVRKEVKYALEKCHKPVIPYVIDTIPPVKYESDEVLISLSLQKQILNEDLSNDLTVMLPYLRQCIGVSEDGNGGERKVLSGKQLMTEPAFRRTLDEGNYFFRQIYENWARIDYLEEGKYDRPFGVYRHELENGVRIAARDLIYALRAIGDGVVPVAQQQTKDVVSKLYKLTYDYSKHFTQDIFDLVEPQARAGVPWACFVLHSKYYNPQGTGSESDGAAQIAFQLLSKAVDDEDNPYAAIQMGSCWQWGIGCDLSGTRAKFWYERALGENANGGQSGTKCEARCPIAYSCLGRLYHCAPEGIDKDDKKAEDYFKKGIAARDATAASRYGDFLWMKGNKQEAVQQYINAYELGFLPALADLAFFARFDDDSDLNEKLSGKYSRKRLLQQVELADIPLWKSYCSTIDHWDSDSMENIDALMHLASDGILWKNPGCASNLADLLISQIEVSDVPKWHDFVDLRNFLYNEIKMGKVQDVQYVKRVVECAEMRHEKGEVLTVSLSGYGNGSWPVSPFWKKLVLSIGRASPEGENNALKDIIAPPSSLDEFNRYVPYKFLEAIRRCPTNDGTALSRVKEIWLGLRELDYENFDSEQIRRGHFTCVSQRLESYGAARLVRVQDLILHLMDLIPEFPHRDERKRVFEDNREKIDGTTMSLTNAEVNARLQTIIRDFSADIKSTLQQSFELRLAKALCDEEHRISHPALSVALDYYRLAYLWGSNPRNAINMATLFFVNNGRLRDTNRNEGFVYYVVESLRTAISQKELEAVPLFLEMSLFGVAVGNSRVEVDLQAVAKSDALIYDMTSPSMHDSNMRMDMLKLEVACAMVAIYLDKELYNSSRCEQKWGVSSLYNPSLALRWLLRAHLLVFECIKSHGGEDPNQIEEPHKSVLCNLSGLKEKIEKKLQEFGKWGYNLEYVQSALNGNQQQNGDAGEVDDDDDRGIVYGVHGWRDRVEHVVEEIKSEIEKLPWSFFPHVKLEEDMVDVAVSTDSTALLLNLLPGDVDYKVVPKQNIACSYGITRVGPKVISLDFVTMLQRIGATLRRLEPDSTVEIGVVASAATCEEIRKALDESKEDTGLNLLCYERLKDQILNIFARHESILDENPDVGCE